MDTRKKLKSDIVLVDTDKIIMHGLDLCRDILGKVNLGDMAFLQLKGRLPTPQESVVFNAIAVTLVEHVVAQNYPSKPIRLIVPYPPGGCSGSRRRGWCWGGDGAVTPGLWHWVQRWLAIAMVLLASLWVVPVVAQNYPSKPIRLIVPYPPGGGTDLIARRIARKLGENLGQQIIVDNRGGAAGNLGTELAAKAAPDGYTLLLLSGTQAVNATLFKKLPYDLVRDFAAISQLAAAPLLLVVHPSLPAKSVKDLIVLARSRPGQLNYATGGSGTGPHVAMELFAASTGVKMIHVPYKGNGPAVIDLVGGHCQLMFANLTGVLTQVQAGRLRALAVSSLNRSPLFPDVPTVAEAGIPGFEVVQWFGLVVPAGTEPGIIARLHAEVTKVLETQEFRELLAKDGAAPVKRSPEEFAVFIKSEIAKWADVIRKSGVQVE